jgi:hypothetical protein
MTRTVDIAGSGVPRGCPATKASAPALQDVDHVPVYARILKMITRTVGCVDMSVLPGNPAPMHGAILRVIHQKQTAQGQGALIQGLMTKTAENAEISVLLGNPAPMECAVHQDL